MKPLQIEVRWNRRTVETLSDEWSKSHEVADLGVHSLRRPLRQHDWRRLGGQRAPTGFDSTATLFSRRALSLRSPRRQPGIAVVPLGGRTKPHCPPPGRDLSEMVHFVRRHEKGREVTDRRKMGA
jgi:hypothetical protein